MKRRHEFAQWVDMHVDRRTHGYGRCKEITAAMALAFPELRVRFGFFHCLGWGQRQHFWLLTPEGEIVDPTGLQHPSGSTFPEGDHRYQDLTDCTEGELAALVPTGRCMECGDPTFRGESFCSDRCGEAYARAMDQGTF